MPLPFLTYLTVFKSRLGIANLVLSVTDFTHVPDATLLRKVRLILEEARPLALDEGRNDPIFQYLVDKRLIGREGTGNARRVASKKQRGRYASYKSLKRDDRHWSVVNAQGAQLSELPTFLTDIWLSHPDIASTVGVPTPENASETLELGFQLRLLTKSKNTVTAAGHLTQVVRTKFENLLPDPTNVFLIGLEAIPLLRQVLVTDGVILRELVRSIETSQSQIVSRDAMSKQFAEIVERAMMTTTQASLSSTLLREALRFRKTIREAVNKRPSDSGSRKTQSDAPGVVEHRITPRLEWLTDLGYLSKEGLPKNSFEYRVTPTLSALRSDLELHQQDDWADEVALAQWVTNPKWQAFRRQVAVYPAQLAFREAYRLLRRRIGPAPLREVAFAAAMMTDPPSTFAESVARLIDFAQQTDGATLSGGRYKRSPENIYFSEAVL
jgi:hypothetical protein